MKKALIAIGAVAFLSLILSVLPYTKPARFGSYYNSGTFTGTINQIGSAVNFMGTILAGNVIQGYGEPVASSSVSIAPTAAQICQGQVGTLTKMGSSSAMTYTYPAATSTYATCANGANIDGTVNQANIIYNTGSAAITLATSTGDTLFMLASSTNSIGAGQAMEIMGQFQSSTTWFLYAQPYLPK